MCLTVEQHLQIASAYEKAAADEALPSQLRNAFVRKAKWFRMLCQIKAAKLSTGLVSAAVETAPKTLPKPWRKAESGTGRPPNDLVSKIPKAVVPERYYGEAASSSESRI